jgi:hypothetical protein
MLTNKDWINTISGVLSDEINVQTCDNTDILVQIQLDILEGCFYNCPGCFVNKQDNYTTDSLDITLNLVKEIHELNNVKTDNIILGPTDFFAAGNLISILKDDRFLQIIELLDDKCIQHNCGIDDVISNNKIREVIEQIELMPIINQLDFDVQIAIDIIRLNSDNIYRTKIKDRINIFKNSKLKYEVSLATNITDNSILNNTDLNLYDAIKMTQNEFNTVLEFLPSVTRSINKLNSSNVNELQLLENWNDILLRTFNNNKEEFIKNFLLVQSDKTHKTHNELLLNINKNNIYIMPFIYENSVIYDDLFRVKQNTLDGIIKLNTQLIQKQYDDIPTTCKECDQLDTCVQRFIILTMNDIFNTNDCIVNKDILNSYNIGK